MKRFLRLAFNDNKAELGRRLGYRDGSFVGQMIRGEKPITETTWARLCALREVKPLLHAQMPVYSLPHLVREPEVQDLLHFHAPYLTEGVSYQSETLRLLTREELMQRIDALPGEFWLELWDDAIGYPAGTRVLFIAGAEPAPGDFVLLAAGGRPHVREYVEDLHEGWIGRPLHDSYATIKPSDGAKVLAVFEAARGRRSQLRR